MRSWLVIAIVLTACKDPDVERLQRAKTAACACKTASCAQHEVDQIPVDHLESTPHNQQTAREMLACLARLTDAERPRTDPDGEGSGDEEPQPASGSAIAPPTGLIAPPSSEKPAAPATGPTPAGKPAAPATGAAPAGTAKH